MVSRVRLIRWLGPASLVAGFLTIALAVARGEANVYLVLIIPIIVGTGPLAFSGILLVFVGFLLTFLLWPWRPDTDSEAQAYCRFPQRDRRPRGNGAASCSSDPFRSSSDPTRG